VRPISAAAHRRQLDRHELERGGDGHPPVYAFSRRASGGNTSLRTAPKGPAPNGVGSVLPRDGMAPGFPAPWGWPPLLEQWRRRDGHAANRSDEPVEAGRTSFDSSLIRMQVLIHLITPLLAIAAP
jgi:hypothetical protein